MTTTTPLCPQLLHPQNGHPPSTRAHAPVTAAPGLTPCTLKTHRYGPQPEPLWELQARVSTLGAVPPEQLVRSAYVQVVLLAHLHA